MSRSCARAGTSTARDECRRRADLDARSEVSADLDINEDAQIVDQLKLNDRTIAAVFGVPAILLGITDTATQKSAEALMNEWLASGLGFIITHIEQAFDRFIGLDKVPAGREWTELDTRVLLRSMFTERMDGLTKAVMGGILGPNEARALEGYKAVKDGDEPRVQQQVVPLKFCNGTSCTSIGTGFPR